MDSPEGPRSTRILPAIALIGRASELARIEQSLAHAGLLLLIGPAGCGKTTLARAHVERRPAERFAFCDVSQAKTVEDLCTRIARTLEMPVTEGSAAELPARLERVIASRALELVVLDDLDQLDRDAWLVVSRWSEAARPTRFLATSRHDPRLRSAHVVRIEPLGTPPASETDPAAIAASPAVELFVVRSRLARPGYALRDSASLVAEIVRKLDGLPLAIELAAARMAVLGEQQLLDLLTHRLDLLRSDAGGGRHVTLRAALDASWETLAPDERRTLAACSVFAGGFSLEAFEEVAVDPTEGPAHVRAVELLEALHDKSLVCAREAPALPGQLRYELYESVREYAADKLQHEGDRSAAVLRHAEHFVRVARAWAEGVHGRGGTLLRLRLATEYDNLLAVVDRSRADVPVELGAEALLALEQVFLLRGPFVVFLRRVSELLDAFADRLAPSTRARLHASRGWAALYGGRHGDAIADFSSALALAPPNDTRVRVLSHVKCGIAHSAQGRHADGRKCFEEARRSLDASSATSRDDWLEGVYWRELGAASTYERGASEACEPYERALRLFRSAGARRDEGVALGLLGGARYELGALSEARQHLKEAIRTLHEVGDHTQASWLMANDGLVATEQGHFEEARGRFDEALDLVRRIGARHFEAHILGYRGNLALEEEQFEEACIWYERTLEIPVQIGRLRGLALAWWASAEAHLGRLDAASRRFEEAQADLLDRYRAHDRQLVDLLRLHVELARASRDPDADLPGLRDKVLALVHEAAASDHSDEMRFAVRVVRRSVEALLPLGGRPLRALIVERGGAWFEWESGERVPIAYRSPNRRVLMRLVSARLESSGRPVTTKDLFEAGWPGERIALAAQANRVKVAVSTLRRLGLRALIESHEAGYRMDPRATIRVADG